MDHCFHVSTWPSLQVQARPKTRKVFMCPTHLWPHMTKCWYPISTRSLKKPTGWGQTELPCAHVASCWRSGFQLVRLCGGLNSLESSYDTLYSMWYAILYTHDNRFNNMIIIQYMTICSMYIYILHCRHANNNISAAFSLLPLHTLQFDQPSRTRLLQEPQGM